MNRIYLKRLQFPTEREEESFMHYDKKAGLSGVYSTYYPFRFFSSRFCRVPSFEMSAVTVFYGGNGSGKSTLLNVIAEKAGLTRDSLFNTTDFFGDFCRMCKIDYSAPRGKSRIITSDDIFQRLSDTRGINDEINRQRRQTVADKWEKQAEIAADPSVLRLNGMADYDRFKEYSAAVRQSTSQYIRNRVARNLQTGSNGETAMRFLTDEITEDGLYLLDEPENSLAPGMQLELKKFLEDSARFFGCQFIIATHSPLLLALEGAKIYNLDDEFCTVCSWNELENVRVYAEFFREHAEEFS